MKVRTDRALNKMLAEFKKRICYNLRVTVKSCRTEMNKCRGGGDERGIMRVQGCVNEAIRAAHAHLCNPGDL